MNAEKRKEESSQPAEHERARVHTKGEGSAGDEFCQGQLDTGVTKRVAARACDAVELCEPRVAEILAGRARGGRASGGGNFAADGNRVDAVAAWRKRDAGERG